MMKTLYLVMEYESDTLSYFACMAYDNKTKAQAEANRLNNEKYEDSSFFVIEIPYFMN